MQRHHVKGNLVDTKTLSYDLKGAQQKYKDFTTVKIRMKTIEKYTAAKKMKPGEYIDLNTSPPQYVRF